MYANFACSLAAERLFSDAVRYQFVVVLANSKTKLYDKPEYSSVNELIRGLA